jgi:hypothetical protein
MATLTSDFWPVGTVNCPTLTSACSPARFQISPSGAVSVIDLAIDMTVGRGIYLDTTYLRG